MAPRAVPKCEATFLNFKKRPYKSLATRLSIENLSPISKNMNEHSRDQLKFFAKRDVDEKSHIQRNRSFSIYFKDNFKQPNNGP